MRTKNVYRVQFTLRQIDRMRLKELEPYFPGLDKRGNHSRIVRQAIEALHAAIMSTRAQDK